MITVLGSEENEIADLTLVMGGGITIITTKT